MSFKQSQNMGETSYTQAQLDAMSKSPGLGFGMFNTIYLATPSRAGNYYMQKIYALLTGPSSPASMDTATAASLKTKLLAYQQRLRDLEAGKPLTPIKAEVIPLPTLQTSTMQTIDSTVQQVQQGAVGAGIAAEDWLNGTTSWGGMNIANKNILYALAGIGVFMLLVKRFQ
jgi:hypothetical protein